MNGRMKPKPTYTSTTVWPAEGARVGIATCELCGASILIDPRDEFSTLERHTEWHEDLEARFEEMSS